MGHNDKTKGERQGLDAFDVKLKAANDSRGKPVKKNPRASAKGLELAVELVATPMIGVAIGLGLDKMFETKPAMMIAFFFLGCIAAFRRILRVAAAAEREAERAESTDDDTMVG